MKAARTTPLQLARLLRGAAVDKKAWKPVVLDVREMTIVGWCGMRGVVALATALSLPWVTNTGIFTERPLIQFLTFVVIIVTLVGQGLTLPALISALGVTRGDRSLREEQRARGAMTRAALKQLDRLSRDFAGSDAFGVSVISPGALVRILRGAK